MLLAVYLTLGLIATTSVVLAVVATRQTRKQGGFRKVLERQARSIFDDLEPQGTPTDYFPAKGPPPSEYLL